VHGSAPQLAGLDAANPAALMLSAALMLRSLGEQAAARRLEGAVLSTIEKGDRTTADLGGNSGTRAFADAVVERILAETHR